MADNRNFVGSETIATRRGTYNLFLLQTEPSQSNVNCDINLDFRLLFRVTSERNAMNNLDLYVGATVPLVCLVYYFVSLPAPFASRPHFRFLVRLHI